MLAVELKAAGTLLVEIPLPHKTEQYLPQENSFWEMEDTLAALGHLPVRRQTLSLPVSPLPEIRLHPSADGAAVLCHALAFLLLLAAAGCVHGPTHCWLRDSR